MNSAEEISRTHSFSTTSPKNHDKKSKTTLKNTSAHERTNHNSDRLNYPKENNGRQEECDKTSLAIVQRNSVVNPYKRIKNSNKMKRNPSCQKRVLPGTHHLTFKTSVYHEMNQKQFSSKDNKVTNDIYDDIAWDSIDLSRYEKKSGKSNGIDPNLTKCEGTNLLVETGIQKKKREID